MPKMGKLVHELEYSGAQHDFSPWVEVVSSRMTAIRYDYATGNIQVEWGNGNPAYVYREAGYALWKGMLRSASKGRYINRHLNPLSFGPVDVDELDVPANPSRSAPLSKAKRVTGLVDTWSEL